MNAAIDFAACGDRRFSCCHAISESAVGNSGTVSVLVVLASVGATSSTILSPVMIDVVLAKS